MGVAKDIVRRITGPPYAVACGAIAHGRHEKEIAPGADPVDGTTLFEIGSITKTFTAALLAHLVLRRQVALETTLGELLGPSPSASITLGSLANHTSGLPFLPPNVVTSHTSPDDPFRDYTVDHLLEALSQTKPGPARYEYSNYGYMLLGHVVSLIGGSPYPELARKTIFDPLGMRHTQVSLHGFPIQGRRIPGYRGAEQVAHWSRHIAGPGGIEASLDDMVGYLAAQMYPPENEIGEAIRMTQTPASEADRAALGWHVRRELLWHTGGTGGFSTFAGWNSGRDVGIVILVNRTPSEDIDRAGYDVISARSGESTLN